MEKFSDMMREKVENIKKKTCHVYVCVWAAIVLGQAMG